MRNGKIKKGEKFEKTDGITLIALVITIIVLLILAAVSIATLTGQNEILSRADEAANLTKEATAREKVEVEVLGSYGNDGNIDLGRLNENLEKVEGLTEGVPIEDGLPATVVVDGYNVTINEAGNVTIGEEKPEEDMSATIILSAQSVVIGNSFNATVTHLGSNISISDCKYILNMTNEKLGENNEIWNTAESFSINPEVLTLTSTAAGTYYLHVLTVDNFGNKIETISNDSITVNAGSI